MGRDSKFHLRQNIKAFENYLYNTRHLILNFNIKPKVFRKIKSFSKNLPMELGYFARLTTCLDLGHICLGLILND